jgi:hypothetical protein
MITILSTLVSALSFRLRSRASLELELLALRHQVSVLRRQHKGRLRLFSTDRLLWVWLYRNWPRCLDAMVLVKPATVIQWHRNGFRLYWRRRSRPLGRPKKSTQIRAPHLALISAQPHLFHSILIHRCSNLPTAERSSVRIQAHSKLIGGFLMSVLRSATPSGFSVDSEAMPLNRSAIIR